MSDKIITYGPGKDVDPEETIGACGPHDMTRTLAKKLEKAYEALQQREERRKKAIDVLHTEIRLGSATNGAVASMVEAIKILEGTDG